MMALHIERDRRSICKRRDTHTQGQAIVHSAVYTECNCTMYLPMLIAGWILECSLMLVLPVPLEFIPNLQSMER